MRGLRYETSTTWEGWLENDPCAHKVVREEWGEEMSAHQIIERVPIQEFPQPEKIKWKPLEKALDARDDKMRQHEGGCPTCLLKKKEIAT